MVKNTHANAGNVGLIPGLGEKMATHSSVLAWRISWAEEPEELQSMGSQGVRHDLTHTTIFPKSNRRRESEKKIYRCEPYNCCKYPAGMASLWKGTLQISEKALAWFPPKFSARSAAMPTPRAHRQGPDQGQGTNTALCWLSGCSPTRVHCTQAHG